jgi:O-antigen/teichoic acid export membrane protein/glutathione synthase/RimK-type ligase-like ATP-grasp enzyme
MTEVAVRPVEAGGDGRTEHGAEQTAHVRGSSLLLSGRLISLGINFATQVLIARHLDQTAFGAFAVAIAIAGLGQVLITLGLPRTVPRFVTADLERDDVPRMVGTILLNVGVIVGLGAVLVGVVAIAQQGWLSSTLVDPAETGLLLILVLLAPIDALDDLLIDLFAVLGDPRAIFVRRYVLAPALRLVVAALVVLADGGAIQLAVGYIVASLFGVVLYGAFFIQLLRRRGIIDRVRGRQLVVPAREVIGASIPLLSTDGIWLLINTFPIFVLTLASGLDQVAAYQVIRPAAALNLLVAASFHVMYLPAATRLAERFDLRGASDLYWRTTIWVAVLTFPIFAATFALGRPLTEFAFGERYESSGIYLSILSVGYMVHAALGFNATTLVAYRQHRAVAVVNGITATVSVAAALLLIPRFGALGAAVAATATLFAQNALLQLALRRLVGIPLIDRAAVGVYVTIAVSAGLLFAMETFGSFGLWTLGLAAVAFLIVLYRARGAMGVVEAFPGINDRLVRLLRPVGRPGWRALAGLDLLRSLRPSDAYRRLRGVRRWADRNAEARAAVYRSIWTEATRAVDADLVETTPGTFELRSGSRRAVVSDHILRLDPPVALDRARDKAAVTEALGHGGVPIPDQLAFASSDFAAARTFLAGAGGPCVVKPADGRTGSGVTTNIRTPSDLLRAVVRAGADSDSLLIERQVPGTVYRLLFLDGRLLDVLARRPPRVVGDGRASIGALISGENDYRLRAGGRAGLSVVKIDLDCLLTLAADGLDLGSVPPAGVPVEVKRTTNQNGSSENWSVLGEVGSDMVEQARRAVELVGLRLAGVDVVTTDPLAPLATTGGAVLEVNGVPGIHYHYLIAQDSDYRPVAIPIVEALLDAAPGVAPEEVAGRRRRLPPSRPATPLPPDPAGV